MFLFTEGSFFMSRQGTFSKEGKSHRLLSVNTLERCAFFLEVDDGLE